jgi:hypothetical protein
MKFKNPWTDGSLDSAEQEFLKKALWQFYIIRNGGDVLNLGSYNDSKVLDFI